MRRSLGFACVTSNNPGTSSDRRGGRDGYDGEPYRWLASSPCRTAGPVTLVTMGQTSSFLLQGRRVTAHNLRSYSSGACDDYWNWAYWVAAQAIYETHD